MHARFTFALLQYKKQLEMGEEECVTCSFIEALESKYADYEENFFDNIQVSPGRKGEPKLSLRPLVLQSWRLRAKL